MSFRIVEATLATAVANAGTVTLAYPAGTAQADFTGANASADGALTLNDNDVFPEATSGVRVNYVYGADNITLTNNTGVSWPAGSRIRAQLGIAGNDTPALTPGPAIADASGDLAAVTVTVNRVIRALRAQGIISS